MYIQFTYIYIHNQMYNNQMNVFACQLSAVDISRKNTFCSTFKIKPRR